MHYIEFYVLQHMAAFRLNKQTNEPNERPEKVGLGWAGLAWVTMQFVRLFQAVRCCTGCWLKPIVLCTAVSHSSFSCGHGSLVTPSAEVDLSPDWAEPSAKEER